MEQGSYKSSFLLALLINMVFILSFSYFLTFPSLIDREKKELVVQLDMSQYELSTGTLTENVKQAQGASQVVSSATASASSMSADSSASPSVYTPYLGGVEPAAVGVAGASVLGSIGGSMGGEGTGNSAIDSGSGIGSAQSESSGSAGYVDVDSYLAKLNSMKTYPQQALRRNLEGAVHFLVTFDSNGNLVDYQLTEGSYDVLNRAASALIERGGSIVNTTGMTQTVPITIHYNLQ